MTNTRWNTLLTELRARRAARAATARLEAELAAYTTPADIADLMAAADRADGPGAEHVRAVLSDNLMAYHSRRHVAA